MAPRASEVVHTVAVFTAWLTCLPAGDPGTSMSDRSKMLSLVYEHDVLVVAQQARDLRPVGCAQRPGGLVVIEGERLAHVRTGTARRRC